jgi:fatty-acyl-CoA synthase
MYVGDYLGRRCVYDPDGAALVDAGTDPPLRLTYAGLNERADRLANLLRARGVGPGDRVAIVAYDGAVFYDLLFACGKLGAVMVPVNWRLHPAEVEGLLRRVTPRLLAFSGEPPMDAVADHLATITGMPQQISVEDLLAEAAAAPAAPVTTETVTEDDTAVLLFTGGTTGIPKAVRITHRQIVWNTINTHLGDIHGTDTYLNVFPLFHTGGLFAFSMPVLILGGTVVQIRRFEPEQVLRLVADERVTILSGVPTMFQMLTASPSWADVDLSSLRFCMSGGAPMPVPVIEQYGREKGVVFRQGFGMTEFGPGVFSLGAADAVRKAGSIGTPNFFVDARVVDPDGGAPRRPGEVGELVLRGPSAMGGYFGDDEATADAFDEHGYFHTGDLARVDDEGYFFIVDRLKDMYVSGGENVYPAEIEAVLYAMPGVAMCAVVGVPDDRWGEVGAAFVVPVPDATLDEGAVLEHLRGRLARFKIPTSVRFVDDLPVSGAGKILKDRLREQVTA